MAARINELKQRLIEAKSALTGLLEAQGAAKTALGDLLEKQVKGETLSAAEAKSLTETEQESKALDVKVSAARRLVTTIEEQVHAEQLRLDAETSAAQGLHAISTHDNREDRPWRSMGEQLVAICAAGAPQGAFAGAGIADPRLFRAASGGSTGVASDGGFLVQSDYSTVLMNRAAEASMLLGMCDSYECSENSDRFEAPMVDETSRATGSRWGGVRVYRRKEAATVTASKPSLKLFELRLEDLMALSYLTGREMQDARMMEQVVQKGFASEVSFVIDDEIISGSGVGEMLGINNSNGPKYQVAVETGQGTRASGKFVLPANLDKMWASMPGRLKGGSVWLINGEMQQYLSQLAVPVGTAAIDYKFVAFDQNGVLRIHGRPTVEVEQCEAPGTEGDVILTNLGEYMILTKGGLKTDASIHVRFIYDEMALRWIVRINGKPKWSSKVTKYKGSGYYSPIVTLAAS